MKSVSITFIIILIISNTLIAHSAPYLNNLDMEQRFCGSDLGDAMEFLCKGKHNDPPPKRDANGIYEILLNCIIRINITTLVPFCLF